jgi:hypothetical protein
VFAQEPGSREVYVPYVPGGAPPATPMPTLAVGERVFGLMGRLEPSQDASYSHRLESEEAGVYALAGETPEVERQIEALASGPPPVMVKVWGVRMAQVGSGSLPLIVVSGILGLEAAPGPGGQSAPVAVVKFDLVNIYAEPSQAAARVGGVVARQACNVTGRNATRTWLYLECADGQEGWIDARLVEVQGSIESVPIRTVVVLPPTAAPTPTPLPTATPVPTPLVFRGWRMEMYSNAYLGGAPVGVTDTPAIDFNWADGSPSSLLPADNFSLRFTRREEFSPGYYQFTAQSDDGVRVYVDDQLLIDEWRAPTGRTYTVGRVLTGEHTLRVEYYEASGLANLAVRYAPVDQSPVWRAAYFPGVAPQGNPVLQQQEPRQQNPLDYNWGMSSPLPAQLGTDFWSARWEGDFPFEDGTYIFEVIADDGVRVWLDGLLVIDQWRDGYKQANNRFVGIGQGLHSVKVEYYERAGQALVRLWWYKESVYVGPR